MNIEEINKLDPAAFEEIRSALPSPALEFVRIIGIEATLALVSCFGGAEVRFVKLESSWSFERYCSAIGRTATVKLADTFGSSVDVYIPRCTRARGLLRNRQIIREFDLMTSRQGISCRNAANELAIKFGLSNRSVQKIVNLPV